MSVSTTDREIIRSFPRYQGAGIPGFIVDFLGTRTRTAYIVQLPQQGGVVEDYPIPDNFHATATEWAGALRAVRDAKETLVVVELGAGWAPWLVSLTRAAEMRGIHDVRLVGVEGSKPHFDCMHSHFLDNGLDPAQHTLLHGIVGTTDGFAEFPILPNPAANWGPAAIFPPPPPSFWRRSWQALRDTLCARRRDASGDSGPTERVRCYSLPSLLRPFAVVDLVHVDIQGAEYQVLASAWQVLKDKVKRVVVGTHGRRIEQDLLDGMAAQSWVLEADESCHYYQHGDRMTLLGDGCQVWRNPVLNSTPAVSGVVAAA